MRFSIRDLLLVTVIVALAVGWWVDHRRLTKPPPKQTPWTAAMVTNGTASIALRFGTPLLPVCVYRLPDDTYMAEAAPHVLAQSTGDKKADEVRVTKELIVQIEGFIRRHPEQWHVPHRIWEGSA